MQTQFINDVNLVAARRLQCEVQRIRHIFSPHVGAEIPEDNVTAVIIEDRAEIGPAPTKDLDVGGVCLPKLVNGRGIVFELVRRLVPPN